MSILDDLDRWPHYLRGHFLFDNPNSAGSGQWSSTKHNHAFRREMRTTFQSDGWALTKSARGSGHGAFAKGQECLYSYDTFCGGRVLQSGISRMEQLFRGLSTVQYQKFTTDAIVYYDIPEDDYLKLLQTHHNNLVADLKELFPHGVPKNWEDQIPLSIYWKYNVCRVNGGCHHAWDRFLLDAVKEIITGGRCKREESIL